MDSKEYHQENSAQTLYNRIIEIYRRKAPPEYESYLKILKKVINTLENEDAEIRPRDSSGLPGGIIYLKKDIQTIIIPDIHARLNFFLCLMLDRDSGGISNLQKLASNNLQIVCVGDGFHAEGRAIKRWKLAFDEYKNEYKKHKNMDEEMRESLGVMEMIMEVKSTFPLNFHFLKGNHENILNDRDGGNYPFRKYAYEGDMVLYYIKKFYGTEFLYLYSAFEKNLPLLAVGKNFLISHAEPKFFFERQSVVNYRKRPDVVEGLTWTDNDDAEDSSVLRMINHYIAGEKVDSSYYFGGHRPVKKPYNLRAKGRYVQIHNPDRFSVALIRVDRDINLDEDIVEIENKLDTIINRG